MYVALLLAARLSVRQQAGGSPTDSRTCRAHPDTRTVTSGLKRTLLTRARARAILVRAAFGLQSTCALPMRRRRQLNAICKREAPRSRDTAGLEEPVMQ